MSYSYDNYPPKEKKDLFQGIIPPTIDNIPRSLQEIREYSGSENYVFEYKNHKNQTCFWVRRKDGDQSKDGKKSFCAYSYCKKTKTWKPKSWTKDRPLFREHRLANNEKPVIVFEGERTALAAEELFPGHVCVSWSGGSNAVFKTNFKHLINREVTLWCDNDEAGLKAMTEVGITLLDNKITENIKIIGLNKDLPEAWDVEDGIPKTAQGVTKEGLFETRAEFIPDAKLEKIIRDEWHGREAKEKLENLSEEYTYIRQTDEFFEMRSHDFVRLKSLDHDWAHIFKTKTGEGNLSRELLADKRTKKVLNYIKLANRESGVINVSKKDHPLIQPGRYINIYNHHHIEAIKGDVSLFVNFYKMLLGEAHWKVMEQVIAFLVQCPGKKMRWAPIIVSDEGGGKGLLGEAVGRILGQLNVATNVGYKDVITTHSTIIRDKILVILNEVVVHQVHAEKKEVTNALKSLITDDFIIINEKHKAIVNHLNTTSIWVYSNKKDCLHLDPGTRRYYVIHVKWKTEDFEKWDKEGKFDELFQWLENKGANYLYHYFKNIVKIENKKLFQGRAPRTPDLEQMIMDNRHPTIKKLDDRYIEEQEPFSIEWVGFISKNQLITWTEANFKGHAPDAEIEQWLKSKAIPWKDGNLTRRIQTEKEGRPRVYLLKNRPKEAKDGDYLDWTEGELGYAPNTGTISLSNSKSPVMKYIEGEDQQGMRAQSLAQQLANDDLPTIRLLLRFKQAQAKALKAIEELDDKNIPVGEDQEGKTIYENQRDVARNKINEVFIKEFKYIFQQKELPAFDGQKDFSLDKRKPPNVKVDRNTDTMVIDPAKRHVINL